MLGDTPWDEMSRVKDADRKFWQGGMWLVTLTSNAWSMNGVAAAAFSEFAGAAADLFSELSREETRLAVAESFCDFVDAHRRRGEQHLGLGDAESDEKLLRPFADDGAEHACEVPGTVTRLICE